MHDARGRRAQRPRPRRRQGVLLTGQVLPGSWSWSRCHGEQSGATPGRLRMFLRVSARHPSYTQAMAGQRGPNWTEGTRRVIYNLSVTSAGHDAWRGVAWRGFTGRDVAWRDSMRRGMPWCGVARLGVAWRGVAWRRVAWRGVARRGAARRCGAVRCGAVRCGAIHP